MIPASFLRQHLADAATRMRTVRRAHASVVESTYEIRKLFGSPIMNIELVRSCRYIIQTDRKVVSQANSKFTILA